MSANKLVKEAHHDIIEERNVECEKIWGKGTVEKQTSDNVVCLPEPWNYLFVIIYYIF